MQDIHVKWWTKVFPLENILEFVFDVFLYQNYMKDS